jgi:hypothetical protein
LRLKQHGDDFTILAHRSPQLPLLTSGSNEDLVHEDGVAIAAVPAPQSTCMPWS